MPPNPPISDTLLWAYVHHEATPGEREEVDAACADPAVARRLAEIRELHHLLTAVARIQNAFRSDSGTPSDDPDGTASGNA